MANKGYTTEALVQDYLGQTFSATTSPTTASITTWIGWAENLIDRKSGTSFTEVTITDEFYDFNQYTAWKSPENLVFGVGSLDRLDQGLNFFRNDRFRLKNHPLVSITALSINNAGASDADDFELLTEQTGSGGNFYVEDLDHAEITFINRFPKFGRRAFKITYVYGFSTIPGIVQNLATVLTAKKVISHRLHLSQFQSQDSISVEGISIQKSATQTVAFLQSATEEIDELWEELGRFMSNAM